MKSGLIAVKNDRNDEKRLRYLWKVSTTTCGDMNVLV